MRSLWIVIYPLVAFLAIAIISETQPFFILGLVAYLFPAGILVGAGVPIKGNTQADWLGVISFSLIYLYVYLAFIIKIKKLSSTSLRNISLALMVAYVFGIKGCATMVSNFTF